MYLASLDIVNNNNNNNENWKTGKPGSLMR